MPCKIACLLFCLLTPVMCSAWVNVSDIPEFNLTKINKDGLTKTEAEALLITALKYEEYNLSLSGVFIDDDLSPADPYYYEMGVGYDTPKAGAVEYWGLFSVSPKTGDIWEEYSCERISSSALQKIQQEIMKKTGATFASEVVQRRGLGCTDE
ncbi:hypothetical protein ACMGGS_11820 [Superficieibacter sp. BNK-5]|uniref:hypothetical protein n=1 Tax=Superficieibacter sp. BNK-5 TaxID=3376142 RepID=UPI0039BFD1DA